MRHLPTARRMLLAATVLVAAGASAAALRTRLQAARTQAVAAVSMASMLPQGALLTIESPDFAALLKRWNASPEQRVWLASDNYSAFSNSRLFGRLNDARAEFEAVATSNPKASASINGDFLNQIAGSRSIFAWYDVGKLEFLYISRITPAQAANIALLKDRSAYSARQAGGITFYMRKTGAAPASPAEDQGSSAQGTARTIAFAEVSEAGGDLLILATREDLIANALLLHQHTTGPDAPSSLAQEPWYQEAGAALGNGSAPAALHMVLNLDRIVPLPYFRSYWVQQNITQMKQYRAAVSDLRLEPTRFQEERALLLRSADELDEDRSVSHLATLAPANGVFEATATHAPHDAVNAIEEKLLGHSQPGAVSDSEAPDPSLDTPQSGSATDLETRIDTPPVRSQAASDEPLAHALEEAGLTSMLTFSTALPPSTPEGLWVPMHSAVVLRASGNWNPAALQGALQQSLRGNLTTATLGIAFTPSGSGNDLLYALSGAKPLFLAVRGSVCLLTNDRALLEEMLRNQALQSIQQPPAASEPAIRLAGFDHRSQRTPFARLTSLVDGTNQLLAPGTPPLQPAFFSGSMRSLSDAFAALSSERFYERRQGLIVRQTVTYQWQNQ